MMVGKKITGLSVARRINRRIQTNGEGGEVAVVAVAVVVVPPEFRLIGSREVRAIVSPRTTRGLGRRRPPSAPCWIAEAI